MAHMSVLIGMIIFAACSPMDQGRRGRGGQESWRMRRWRMGCGDEAAIRWALVGACHKSLNNGTPDKLKASIIVKAIVHITKRLRTGMVQYTKLR